MEITEEQLKLLNSLTCERLSESVYSKKCAEEIVSKRGSQLVGYLQHRGEEEDSSGNTAFYIVRNNDDLPLAFFSLKCGLLFSPSLIDSAESNFNTQQHIIEILDKGKDESDPQSIALFKSIEDLAVKHNCSLQEMIQKLKNQAIITKRMAYGYKTDYHRDEKTEANKPIYRVHITYPGIEIVHFCTNDNAKEFWLKQKIHHPMGEVIFWWFIMPRLQRVQQIAGCQYAYLFAADSSEDRTLVNYYNVALKFEKPEGIGTSKPRYDFCCELLIQEINKLIAYQTEYFKHFNIDEDTDIV
ncbi:MAG: hypothetical protein LKE75_11670 [Lachnospiraceae bacterium]|jgi:hypothetical protein|nr:hypothetical protein [Lachnospiraceae bacterium]MCH4032044.1 hypothetical protein [Lachnospiraceae bacterium]MCH4070661.1 hypothetical protein [Lachnospiraceae bacterium]MCH4109335.1 hypothetical protein [Lachnospiraceae bacterium]MCI1556845.1 hypothetical protein [Lachnospiraceae bacterium]